MTLLPESEAPLHEAPRRVADEASSELVENFHLYEAYRADKERDTLIAYARSAAHQLAEGLPVAVAIQYMAREIPANRFDRHELIPFLNHLLTELGSNLQFDVSLNAFTETSVISSGEAESILRQFDEERMRTQQEECEVFAEKIGQRLIGGLPFDMLMTIAKSDIVWECMDSVRIAEALNRYLEAHGAPLRVNRYLEQES